MVILIFYQNHSCFKYSVFHSRKCTCCVMKKFFFFIPNTSAKSMPFRMNIIELFMMYVHVFKNEEFVDFSKSWVVNVKKKKRLIKFSNVTISFLLWYVFHNMYTGILKWVHVKTTLRFWLFRGIVHVYNFGFIKTWIDVRDLITVKTSLSMIYTIICNVH